MRIPFDSLFAVPICRTIAAAIIVLALFAVGRGFGQDDGDARPIEEWQSENDPNLSAWRFVADLELPKDVAPKTQYGVVQLTAPVIGESTESLSDLRLTDAAGKRIPYALRVRRTASTQAPIAIQNSFDGGVVAKDQAYEKSIELAPVPLPGHNEIEIDTPGNDFRRLVQVFGSNSADFANAQALLPPKTYLVRFQTQGRIVAVNKFRYENKLFRFLKVRVEADRYNGETPPAIERIVVYQSQQSVGKYLTYPVMIGEVQGVRGDQGPATAYQLTLGHEPTFCEKLTLQVDREAQTERPFRLEIGDKGQIRETIGGVEWRWRTVNDQRFVDLTFPEVRARALRLVITDFANPPMRFHNATGTMAAREVYFAWPDLTKTPLPMKLFFGNAGAQAPRYDLERNLPNTFEPPAAAVNIGERRENPGYVPPPLDFSERHPWAIYGVLAAACLVLAALLVPLAKTAIARSEASGAA